ncbi:hypothetical protein ACFPM0_34350 [Pseudonocardia sulfidoxydans]|uniref:hypothetical protein n=1 Tax=Pseudonocardia sulfidoxydans TaxID=54011 RepID=UPI00360BFFDC
MRLRANFRAQPHCCRPGHPRQSGCAQLSARNLTAVRAPLGDAEVARRRCALASPA